MQRATVQQKGGPCSIGRMAYLYQNLDEGCREGVAAVKVLDEVFIAYHRLIFEPSTLNCARARHQRALQLSMGALFQRQQNGVH